MFFKTFPIAREKLKEHDHSEWIPRMEHIANLFDQKFNKKAKIIQLGCGCGFILDALWEAGFKNLTGLDKNETSLKTLDNPSIKKIQGDISEKIDSLEQYDIVLCSHFLYVLPDSEIFEKIANKTKDYLVLVEKENERVVYKTPHYNRDYQKVFEPFGFKQMLCELNTFPFVEPSITTTRVFKKNA